MEQIGLIPNEKILVANIANGERLETYVIETPKGSHTISPNGAAAHKGQVGDLLVIMSFAQFEDAEARSWKPKVLVLGDGNKIVTRADDVLVAKDILTEISTWGWRFISSIQVSLSVVWFLVFCESAVTDGLLM